jgi:hypothetical protein
MFRALLCPSSGASCNCPCSLWLQYDCRVGRASSCGRLIEAAWEVGGGSWRWAQQCPKHVERSIHDKAIKILYWLCIWLVVLFNNWRCTEPQNWNVFVWVFALACTYICVSLSLIRCKHKPLQLQRVRKIGQTKKEGVNYSCSLFMWTSLPVSWQHFFNYVTASGMCLSVITPLDYRMHSLRQ